MPLMLKEVFITLMLLVRWFLFEDSVFDAEGHVRDTRVRISHSGVKSVSPIRFFE